uniref:VWFA domain-containing protein n=1 Tax=Gadus morhua TaxID=8049 RepID=A0A8C5AAA0_GADMO
MKIPPETVQQWASVLSVQLRDITIKYSGSLLLQKKLKDVEPIVKIVELDGMDLVKDFSEDIERMLGSKMKSVKRLAESAEDADLYHDFNATMQFDYYNSMLINSGDEDGNFAPLGGDFPLEENEHFNQLLVNVQQSDIQVPTNVYNRDPNILNAIYNSEALNDVFINNFQKDPTLTWQYFGSSTGFFRIYPGIKWTPDANGVAAYDCRNRNWWVMYIQAATSPKDIIIMVDISGSMKGLKMTIAKHTINTILDTLGENDFVNIIAYTDYVRYVEPCFRGTLVQADLDNREHFKTLVDGLHVKGEAKINKAMKEAFKVLNLTRSLGQGSMCNQAIMLITDGAMEDYEEVFKEFNWPDRRVRVFTYLIGREMTFAQNTKWIACNNKGYYTHISTLADVQENVMEYLHVLSRPMVINHDHDIIWTEAYMDTVLFTTKAQSLLLMTSVAMPVFSKKKETLSHGILLGVVGTDIPLLELMKLAPRYMYKDGRKLKPKPNYNSVDLAEVEWEDTDELLRTAMVRGETGRMSLNVRASLDKAVRGGFVNSLCPHSFGMVLTKGHGQYMVMGNVSVEEGLHDLMSPDLSISSEWTYCELDIDPHHRKYSQLQAATRYLLGKEPDLECDERLLQQTLFDAVVTAPLEAYWNALMLNEVMEGVETAFLGTRSGLTRLFRYHHDVVFWLDRKFLTPSDKDNLFTVDHFPLWYRLAVENPPGKFYYYSDLNCFLIDNNGFILLSKERSEVHTHTHARVEIRARARMHTHTHTQAHRHIQTHTYTHISKPINTHTGDPHTQTTPSTESINKCCVYSVFSYGSHKQKKLEAQQPCDTAYPGFLYDDSIREANSLIKCGRCQKMFVVQYVPESNLVLVVTQADCDCSRQYEHNATVKCNRMKSQKVRRRPESCHAYHPKVTNLP